MEIERLLPLLIIWIIWRILTNRQKAAKEKTGVSPVFSKQGSKTAESVEVATLPSPPISKIEAEEQPILNKTVMPPPVRLCRRPRRGLKCPDRSFLQQAVVWAEILAPPVSLRDSHRTPQRMSLLDKNVWPD